MLFHNWQPSCGRRFRQFPAKVFYFPGHIRQHEQNLHMLVFRPISRIIWMRWNQIGVWKQALLISFGIKTRFKSLKVKILRIQQTAEQVFNRITTVKKAVCDNVKQLFSDAYALIRQIFRQCQRTAVQLTINVTETIISEYLVRTPRRRQIQNVPPMPDFLSVIYKFKKFRNPVQLIFSV